MKCYVWQRYTGRTDEVPAAQRRSPDVVCHSGRRDDLNALAGTMRRIAERLVSHGADAAYHHYVADELCKTLTGAK